MKLKFEPTHTDYCVRIDDEIFAKHFLNDELELYYKLDEIEGISSPDYDGHFGPYIYFTVDLEYDIQSLLNKVEKVIQERIDS